MITISSIANSDKRYWPVFIQFILICLGSIIITIFIQNYFIINIIFPVMIGWYLNANEVHRIILIPIWIIISLIVGAAIY